ncbi:lipopolysaccharide biosynthesis protein [Algoriphagus limi]|uniref:Membrane protein involved in the export of O-antigen and teichoic acid n=1 Tax=Algoriphagus limi TaxID=2975273 RepID=A0ABT2G1N3_9BACT|nr:hypothetical protein [Algoriphagus limi]MCS5489180.1 hypothetical protein [Algoriphagus limi]
MRNIIGKAKAILFSETGKRSTQVLGFQLIVFLMSFGSNIIIIRSLDKNDYAIFTLAATIIGMLSAISDSGISVGFRQLAGKIWDHPVKFADLLETLVPTRRKILLFTVPIVGLIGGFLFYEQGLDPIPNIILIILIVLIAILEIHRAIYIEVLRFQSKVHETQWSDILLQFTRLVFVGAFFYILDIYWVILVFIASSYLATTFILKKAKPYHSDEAVFRADYYKVLIDKFKKLLPNTSFYLIQGQISIFILSIFNNSSSLADFGALSRITIFFTLVQSVTNNILAPNFSRLNNPIAEKKYLINFMLIIISISIFVVLAVFLSKNIILMVLGDKYQYLGLELLLMAVATAVNFIFTSISSMNLSKGWVNFNARLAIPVSILCLIGGGFFLNLENLSQVIIFSTLPVIGTGFLKILDTINGLKTSVESI